jgi:hypothetical protein
MYSISLVFKSNLKDATFHALELDSSNIILYGLVKGTGVGNIHFDIEEFTLDKISDNVTGKLHHFEDTSGGQLILKREIVPGPSSVSRGEIVLKVWGILFSIYSLIIIPVYFIPQAIQNLGSAIQATHAPKYPWWVYTLWAVIILGMLLLVINSGVIFNEYDALNYLSLALSGRFFSDTRLPGYPVFLRLALWVSHYNLNGVIFLQATTLALSVITSIWVLRRWIYPLPAILFVLLSVFSPAQIHWSRWILRESLFTSLLLLGTTAAIAHFTSSNYLSKLWLYIFATICGYSFLVRENGILLPVALMPVLVPEAIKRLLSSDTIWERIRSLFLLVLRYWSPVITLAIIYSGFSTYNYLHYGYFQVGIHQTSHAFLARTIYPGNSDARSLLNPGSSVSAETRSYSGWPLYSSFILAQDQAPGLDPIYLALYPSVKQQMSDHGVPPNTFHLASILNGIGRG